jgi:hypothetical protein
MTRNDPQTSVDAWLKALQDARGIRGRVLAIVALHGPLTLDQLVREYARYRSLFGWKPASEQGIRSRCAELAHAKPALVEAVPDELGVSRFGNSAQLWRAARV